MESDKVLQIIELENKKVVLEIIKEQARKNELWITNNRGQYKVKYEACLSIIVNINTEINFINEAIEELTGINQNKTERMYEV